MSSDILSLILSTVFGAVFITAMTVSMCKPDRLRHRELPAWFWAALAGRESRARLRFILASRGHAAPRERSWQRAAAQMERDLTARIQRELPLGLAGCGCRRGRMCAACDWWERGTLLIAISEADAISNGDSSARVAAALRRADELGVGQRMRRALGDVPFHIHAAAGPDAIRPECGCAAGALSILAAGLYSGGASIASASEGLVRSR